MSSQKPVFVLHGGAGVLADGDYAKERAHLRALTEAARDQLNANESALDVVVTAVKALEASGLYVAGKGSSPNRAGRFELDAALMDGARREAGAVSALEGFISPIEVAHRVMTETPHVLLAGSGASHFAYEQNLERVHDAVTYYTPAAAPDDRPIPTGTVGAVALDKQGRLAAATSTGGTLNKVWGRVGDTPIIGSGTWADERAAISCTGQGEFFMRANAAADVSARMKYSGLDLSQAVDGSLGDVARLGGEGGLIAVSNDGQVCARFNSPGMKRALLHGDGQIEVNVD
jgi:L-asparaginase/beta-aspartyl-peptidase (threonine type)